MIKLSCDMCEIEYSLVNDVVMNLAHFAIVRKSNPFDEQHFCPKCRKEFEAVEKE